MRACAPLFVPDETDSGTTSAISAISGTTEVAIGQPESVPSRNICV